MSGSSPRPITIVLIDDNRLVREGLAGLIRAHKDFTILAASAHSAEALQKVRTARPRVVLLDLGLEDQDSLLITTTIQREVPEVRVIVMGMLPVQEDIAALVGAGARGFLMKDASVDEFLRTIRAVAAGETVLPSQLTSSLFSEIARSTVARRGRRSATVRLTRRERQVIDLIAEGFSNKEIARRLTIAVHTVKSHVHNLLEKLALRTRLEVAAFTRGESDA